MYEQYKLYAYNIQAHLELGRDFINFCKEILLVVIVIDAGNRREIYIDY